MKYLTFALAAILFLGCDKSDLPPSSDSVSAPLTGPILRFDFQGVTYSTTKVIFTDTPNYTLPGFDKLTIQGDDLSGMSFSLSWMYNFSNPRILYIMDATTRESMSITISKNGNPPTTWSTSSIGLEPNLNLKFIFQFKKVLGDLSGKVHNPLTGEYDALTNGEFNLPTQ